MILDGQSLYQKFQNGLEDPWSRRLNQPVFSSQVELFGRQIRLESNGEQVLQALDLSSDLFSHRDEVAEEPFKIQIVVRNPALDPGSVPENLFDHITYSGDAGWLNLQFGEWGNCFIDLQAGKAIAVISDSFHNRPDLISRCMLNTIVTNFFIASGFGMLHTSCLLKKNQALMLMAPHGSGKSTTALRLVLAGYRLLSDSMIFIDQLDGKVQLHGFPVGRIKLRTDMLAHFPQFKSSLQTEVVRGEVKYVVNLGKINPNWIEAKSVSPNYVHLCLLTLNGQEETWIEPLDGFALQTAIMENSLYYDTQAVWVQNLAQIERMLAGARAYRLLVGRREEDLIEKMDQLWLA